MIDQEYLKRGEQFRRERRFLSVIKKLGAHYALLKHTLLFHRASWELSQKQSSHKRRAKPQDRTATIWKKAERLEQKVKKIEVLKEKIDKGKPVSRSEREVQLLRLQEVHSE